MWLRGRPPMGSLIKSQGMLTIVTAIANVHVQTVYSDILYPDTQSSRGLSYSRCRSVRWQLGRSRRCNWKWGRHDALSAKVAFLCFYAACITVRVFGGAGRKKKGRLHWPKLSHVRLVQAPFFLLRFWLFPSKSIFLSEDCCCCCCCFLKEIATILQTFNHCCTIITIPKIFRIKIHPF